MLPEIFNTGLNPNVWGNGAWIFLHSISLTYPNDPTNNDKKNYKIFFETLGYLIPCNHCSNHYNEFLSKNPINNNVLKNKESLTRWLYNAHNNVNNILNKKKINFNEFINNYNDMYSNKHDVNNNYYIYIIILLLLIIIGGIIYKISCCN
jgi:hypothetical protein